MTPLFMWAGGKTKLINNEYGPYLPPAFDKYHEPFFGGGAMFIWAYETNPNAEFYINDINPDIVNIYKSIRDDVDEFTKITDRFAIKYMSLSPPKRRSTSCHTTSTIGIRYSQNNRQEELSSLKLDRCTKRIITTGPEPKRQQLSTF